MCAAERKRISGDSFVHRKKQLHKLIVARADIAAALETGRFFLGMKNAHDELFYPLVTAMIVCYTRPFTANDPFGPLPSKWSKYDNARYETIHKALMDIRHRAITHSDLSVRKVLIFPPGTVLPDPINKSFAKWYAAVNHRLIQPKLLLELDPMLYNLWNRLDIEVQTLMEKLFESKNLPLKEFELTFDTN